MNVLPAHLGRLTQLMNAAELRQRVISQNLANVNTPGYQRKEVEFEALLSKQMRQGGGEAAMTVQPKITESTGLSIRGDGNNVDIDQEISELNRNSMMFQSYSQLLASQFDTMRRAIR